MHQVIFRDLGVIPYKDAWDYQEQVFSENIQIKLERRKAEMENRDAPLTETSDYLLFCEHPHVYTLGKSGSSSNLLADEQKLKEIDASYFPINRGGDITYHGYGQIVGYPIFDLEKQYTDIHRFLRELEEVIMRCMADFGISSGRIDKLTGVWVDYDNPARARKICAMGIRCSRWITMHGFALNVNTDLSYFDHIVPCGITDKAVTSMEKELGRPVDMNAVKERLLSHFQDIFSISFDKPTPIENNTK